ncbi:MAG: glycosyltransferase, partial [Flavobacterium sp.]
MKASIIIPTRNRADQLSRTMKSLVELDFNTSEFEIIIVDNGSTDSTEHLSKEFINKYP